MPEDCGFWSICGADEWEWGTGFKTLYNFELGLRIAADSVLGTELASSLYGTVQAQGLSKRATQNEDWARIAEIQTKYAQDAIDSGMYSEAIDDRVKEAKKALQPSIDFVKELKPWLIAAAALYALSVMSPVIRRVAA